MKIDYYPPWLEMTVTYYYDDTGKIKRTKTIIKKDFEILRKFEGSNKIQHNKNLIG